MIFRQLFERDTSTYTYLLGDEITRQALLIDPVKGELPKLIQLLDELDLKLVLAVDTHVHADHITALGALREATGCDTAMGEPARAGCVSRTFTDGDTLRFGDYALEALHTPGHTDDSYSFLLRRTDGAGYLFTGDTLLIRGTGRTDFQNGDPGDQYESLFHRLLELPGDTVVYPGHDYKGWTRSTIAEERAHNPRLQVADKAAYIDQMNTLDLPNPRHMHVAVPANLTCGLE